MPFLFLPLILLSAEEEGKSAPPPALAPADELRKNAEAGDPETQFELGHRLIAGKGATQDPAEGIVWLRKAAAQVHQKSKMLLAASGVSEKPPRIVIKIEQSKEAPVIYKVEDKTLLGKSMEEDIPHLQQMLQQAHMEKSGTIILDLAPHLPLGLASAALQAGASYTGKVEFLTADGSTCETCAASTEDGDLPLVNITLATHLLPP